MEEEEREQKQCMRTHLLFKKKKKNKEYFQKGVGGFRPVIKWDEVTLRKRKMADTQILICIYTVGFLIIALGILFFFLGLYVIKPQCPFRWTGIQDRCLYISSHNTSWISAKDFCEEQGGHMVDIANESENDELLMKMSAPTWIGLYRNRSADFKWVSGAPASYQRFSPSPRNGLQTSLECVHMNMDGTWKAETNCNIRYSAACEYAKFYFPFILIGPVLVICGCIVLLLSIEVCKRHRATLVRAKGFIDEEELPNVDDDQIKKDAPGIANPAFVGTPKSSWKRLGSNKTVPEVALHDKRIPPDVESPGMAEDLKMKSGPSDKSSLNIQEDTQIVSKSQEQLELLLSPKNLR